jgi:hypothetical protein
MKLAQISALVAVGQRKKSPPGLPQPKKEKPKSSKKQKRD